MTQSLAQRAALRAAQATVLARRERRHRWIRLVLFLVSAALYYATFPIHSDGLILGNDVVPYAQALALGTPEGYWNPHHLLFHPLAGMVTEIWCALTLRPVSLERVLEAQCLISAVGGAAAVTLVFRFAAHLCRTRAALAFAALFAFSSGTWLYASVGETYLPATAALAALLVRCAEIKLSMRRATPILVGAWLYLAVMLRQDSVIVVPVLFLLLPWRTAVAGVGGAGMLSVGMYGFAWLLSGSEAGFFAWLRGLADSGLWGGAPDLSSWEYSLGLILTAVTYVTWYELGWGLAFAVLLIAALLPPRRVNDKGLAVAAALAGFVALRFFFFTWWQPSNMEYHAGSVLPLVMLAALIWNPALKGLWSRLRDGLLFACVTFVASGNLFTLVIPSRGDEMARRAERAVELAGEGGLVVSLDLFQHYAVLRTTPEGVATLSAAEAVGTQGSPGPALDRARAAIDDTLGRGAPVVLTRDVILAERFYRMEFHVNTESFQTLIRGYERDGEERDDEGRIWAWRLAPP